MIDSKLNPHLVAVEILEECMAKGERFAYDETIVVLADLYRKDKDE